VIKRFNLLNEEFVRFKVPSNLNTAKSIEKELVRIAAYIDKKSMEYVGVPLSGLIVEKHKLNLQKRAYFLSTAGEVCSVGGVDTENATGFSLIITKKNEHSIAEHSLMLFIKEPSKYAG
jgi:hypothetical protein